MVCAAAHVAGEQVARRTSVLSVSSRPLARARVVAVAVRHQVVGDGGHERVLRIGIRQKRADREEHLGDGERGRPLVLQNVQANLSARADVAVVDARAESNLWWLERVVRGEMDVEEESAPFVGRTSFGPVMLLTHSVRLSPFGPAVQLHGGSREISASSFWMRLWHELRMDAMAMAAGSGVHPPRRAEQDSTPVDGLGCRSAPNCHDGTSAATTTFAE